MVRSGICLALGKIQWVTQYWCAGQEVAPLGVGILPQLATRSESSTRGRDSSIAPHRTCSTPQFFAIFKIWFHSGSVSYIISLQDFCSTTRQCKLRRVLRQVCNTKSVVKPACLCLCLFFPCLLPLVILSVLAPPPSWSGATVSKKQAVHHTPPHNR